MDTVAHILFLSRVKVIIGLEKISKRLKNDVFAANLQFSFSIEDEDFLSRSTFQLLFLRNTT